MDDHFGYFEHWTLDHNGIINAGEKNFLLNSPQPPCHMPHILWNLHFTHFRKNVGASSFPTCHPCHSRWSQPQSSDGVGWWYLFFIIIIVAIIAIDHHHVNCLDETDIGADGRIFGSGINFNSTSLSDVGTIIIVIITIMTITLKMMMVVMMMTRW